MDGLLEKYGIDRSLSVDVKLTLLEKERQKVLRKLNHVFGDARKEQELSEELDRMEAVMEELEEAGGRQLSMEDVKVEVRALSQTQLTFSEEEWTMEEKEAAEIAELGAIRKLQSEVMKNQGRDLSVCVTGIRRIADFYESRKAFGSLETWLTYGAQWVPHPYFVVRLYQSFRRRTDEDADVKKRFYWTKRAADMGDKDACFELAQSYFDRSQPGFNVQEAAYYFAKAAGKEYPEAYLQAFRAFVMMKDYDRAGLCMKEAEKKGLKKTWPGDCKEIVEFGGRYNGTI